MTERTETGATERMGTGMTERTGSGTAGTGRLAGRLIALGITGSIAAYKAVELLRRLPGRGCGRDRPDDRRRAKRFVGPFSRSRRSARRPVESDVLDVAAGRPHRPHRGRRLGRCDRRRPGNRPLARGDGERPRRRHGHGHLPRVRRAGRRRTGDGRRHVSPPGDPHERRTAARVRLRDRRTRVGARSRRARRGSGRLAALPAIVDAVVEAIGDRPVRAAGPAGACRPPPVRHPSRPDARPDLAGRHIVVTAGGTPRPSIRSGSSATVRPARWASRSRRRRSIAGRRVTLIAGETSACRCRTGSRRRGPRRDGRARCARRSSRALQGRSGQRRLRRARHGGRRRRLPAGAPGRGQARARRGADARARADPGHPGRGRRSRRARQRRGSRPATRRAPGRCSSGSPPRRVRSSEPPAKLRRKGLDLLVANDVAEAGSGFGTDTNRVTIYARSAGPAARSPPSPGRCCPSGRSRIGCSTASRAIGRSRRRRARLIRAIRRPSESSPMSASTSATPGSAA